MSRTSRLVMTALAILAVVGMTVAGAAKAPSLDGRSFAVKLMKADAKTGDADTLRFSNGMFDSSACHVYGFGESTYTAKNVGKTITFEVHAVAKDASKQTWNGTVEGNRIYGTMKLTDPKGMVTHFKFKGEMRTT
jgi:hypothetical protein